MKLLFIAALMVVWVSPLRSTPCKTVLRVKQDALEYACQTQKRPLQKAFGIIPIPSVINGGNRGILGLGLGLVDNVVKLAGVRILDVKLPELNVKMMPNVGLQVTVDTSFQISGSIVLVGNIDIKAEAGVLADMRVTRTDRGLPILSVSACKSVVGGIKVTGGPFGLLPGLINIIKGHFEAVLSELLCVSVSNVFLGFNANLGLLVGVSAIGGNRGLQYTMPSAPVVTGDYMDVIMNVEYEVDKQVVEIPNGGKDFTLPPEAGNKDAMVNFGLSQDFFISMFTAFQSSGGFDFEIPSTSVSVRTYLTTSVLGSHIPEISWKYKESLPVDLKIELTQTPIVTLDSNFLLVQISPVVEMFVVTGTMRNQHLMTLNVGASLIAKLNVSKGKIMTSVGLQG
ncbi:PREDICTED: BPI fold-containing family B member 2 [Nanorana parkeri]|uniref:BPI fold-containing family B member 2 n=1 Tax=Nanorana parkeri TaxID=125878 RepID=UPI0008544D8A|nr:PREDICTED: BPI fold-containing family B member 2 [Nanorana parkeri]